MKKKVFSMIALLLMAATGAMAQTYSVTLKEGTEDAANWTITPNPAAEGAEVTITYTGTKKVIGVKVEKKSEAVENAYLKWDADQKKLVATEIPTTATKVENSNENVPWQGTYVVDGEVTINGEITLNGDVNLIIKDGAKLTANRINGNSKNLSIYGQAQMTGELVVNGSTDDAIKGITILEVHSAKVKATASSSNDSYSCGGFYGIEEFNVYGGLVDAKGTAKVLGYGICLTADGSMKIYGGEVKAEGKGAEETWCCGILCDNSENTAIATVTVNGGKLWSGNADKRAIAINAVNLQKGAGFTGKIETSADNSAWAEYTGDATPTTKYVRVGY